MSRRKNTVEKTLSLFDYETGAISQQVAVYQPAKYYFRDPHITVFQQALETLAKGDLGTDEWRVFALILGKAGMGNEVIIPFKDAAAALGMQRPNFTRAVNKLVERGILVKGSKVGNTPTLRINYSVAWKGKIKEHLRVKVQDIPVQMNEN